MDRFGYKNISYELNGKGIHDLDNVMTLEANAHEFF